MSTPRVLVGADRPNIEALAAFGADADRGPVVMVNLAEYPSHRAFLQMILSEEYEQIAHLRSGSLERSELHPTYPDDLPTPGWWRRRKPLDAEAASG